MDIAHEEGINFFDTADRYGTEPDETETMIGNWFASGGGRRHRTIIATKVYGEMGSWPNEGKLEEIWQAIEVPVQAGKILYAGSSNFRRLANRMVQTRIAKSWRHCWPPSASGSAWDRAAELQHYGRVAGG